MPDSICAQCKDLKNPVTSQNGGTLYRSMGDRKVRIADVHLKCKDAWLTKNGAADFAGIEDKKVPRIAKQNYEIVSGNVIVACPRGHKNQGQKVSDRQIQQRLVCANPSCNAEWTQTLPQIATLEEA